MDSEWTLICADLSAADGFYRVGEVSSRHGVQPLGFVEQLVGELASCIAAGLERHRAVIAGSGDASDEALYGIQYTDF